MRSVQMCVTGLGVALGCTAGCELVTGLTGTPTLIGSGGSGGGGPTSSASSSASASSTSASTSASSSSSTSASSSASSASSASSSGGSTLCTTPPCAFGQTCTSSTDCATGYCNPMSMTCDAQTILSGLDSPNSLVVDPENLYWADADQGTVVAADIMTTSQTMVASGLESPAGLVGIPGDPSDANPTQLAWVDPPAGNMDVAGFGSKPTPMSSVNDGVPQAVIPGGEYWTTLNSPNGDILYRNAASSNGYGIAAMIYGVPGSIAPAGDVLVYTVVEGSSSSLWTYTPTGSTTAMLVPSTAVAGLAADATNAYWSDGLANGNVALVALASGTPVSLAHGQPSPADVAVDAFDAYWINQGAGTGNGAVMRAPLSGGGTPVALAAGQVAPRGLFLTTNGVYWLTGAKGQGAVKTVPK